MYRPNQDPLANVPQVDARSTHEHFQSGDVDLLDVREPEEWNLGHIEGAAWIPMGHLQARWREIDPARKLVVVCRSGSRSNYVAAMLRQVGIDAANLEGGMHAWEAEKLPITPPGIVG